MVGEPTLIIAREVFLLEAKAIWEHTCIAGDLCLLLIQSYLSHEMIGGCKNTGVKKIRIHDIRHSHASLLINQGCDALMLADRLGHEKVSTTLNTYSHLFPHKQQELVHSLESLQTTDLPAPEPPPDNPLLEAAGITCEVPQTQGNGSDVTIRP